MDVLRVVKFPIFFSISVYPRWWATAIANRCLRMSEPRGAEGENCLYIGKVRRSQKRKGASE